MNTTILHRQRNPNANKGTITGAAKTRKFTTLYRWIKEGK